MTHPFSPKTSSAITASGWVLSLCLALTGVLALLDSGLSTAAVKYVAECSGNADHQARNEAGDRDLVRLNLPLEDQGAEAERAGIACREQESRFAVAHELPVAADVGGNEYLALGHGLEGRVCGRGQQGGQPAPPVGAIAADKDEAKLTIDLAHMLGITDMDPIYRGALLHDIGKLEELFSIQPPRNWATGTHGGPRRLVYEHIMELEEEKKAGA